MEIVLIRADGLLKWMESEGIPLGGNGLLMGWMAGNKEKPANEPKVSEQKKREAVLKQWREDQAKNGKPYKIGGWTRQQVWGELRKMDPHLFDPYEFHPGECPSTSKTFFIKQKLIRFIEG